MWPSSGSSHLNQQAKGYKEQNNGRKQVNALGVDEHGRQVEIRLSFMIQTKLFLPMHLLKHTHTPLNSSSEDPQRQVLTDQIVCRGHGFSSYYVDRCWQHGCLCLSASGVCVSVCVCGECLQLGHSGGATRDKLYVSVSLFTCSVSLR